MKKPSVVSFLITLLLAAAVCTQGQEPVLDIDNNPVEINNPYFILPVNSGPNDGVEGLLPLSIQRKPVCPFGISQGVLRNNAGLPISFYFPFNTTETIVKTFYAVTIEFKSDDVQFCEKNSKFWVVNETSSSAPILVAGNPKKPNSWFQIKDDGATNTYKLTQETRTVGTIPAFSFNGRELVLTNDNATTMLVQFQKVPPASTSTSILRLRSLV